METGAVRRRLRLRQRHRAPRRRRRRRPGQRRPRPQLQDDLPRPQGPALQHLRRRPLRDPARPRRQPADVELRRRQARPDLLGRDARPEGRGQIQGQDQPVRRPDVDRRSGRLPEVPRARPGDRKPLRAERRTVRSGGRPAEGTARQRRRILVRSGEADLRPSPTATTRSAPPGSTSTSPCRAKANRSPPARPARASCPRRARPGWSDTWMISSKAKHPNCMYMWMNWIISPKANAEVAEFFGEAPAQSLACDETADKNFCDEIPRRKPGLLEAGLLLGDPAGRMRQRRRRLQGLQRLGPSLDRNQRLERAGPESMATEAVVARRSVGRRLAGLFHGRPRLQVGALLAGPVGLAGHPLPGVAGGPADHRLLDGRPAQRRSRSRASASKTSKRSSTNRSTATSSGGRSGPRPWSPSPTRSSPSRSPSTWPRWRAAAARRSSSSRC